MAKKDKLINIGIQNIAVSEYTIKSPEKMLPIDHVFTFDFLIQHNALIEENLFIVTPTVKIFEAEDKQHMYCSLTAMFVFNVANLKDFITEVNGEKIVADDCIMLGNSISVSSIRGILFERNRGTFLQNIPLPILDPAIFISKKNSK